MSDTATARLGIDGGSAVRSAPFHAWPVYGEREEQLLLDVLHSGRWGELQGDKVLAFVNGMGGTPMVELYIAYRKAYEIATQHGLKVVRNLVGPYITSLEMAGASITMLKMDDDMLKLWDAPVKTPGLRWGV